MKKSLTLTFLFFCLSNVYSQKVDTLYYDSNFKGVPIKSFATFMSIVYMSDNPNYPNMEKTFYITGELQGEFTPVFIDKFDLNKSKFIGKYTTYYKSGKKRSEGSYNDTSLSHGQYIEYYENGNSKGIGNYNNGLLEGEMKTFYESGKPNEIDEFIDNKIQNSTVYYENGNIKGKATFVNEKINGTMYQYYEDGSGHLETEMQDGNPKFEYVTYVDKNGNRTKYDKNLENIIADDPTANDRKSTISNGKNFYYYQMNGIFIAVDINAVNEIDKFWEASLVIGNNTNKPFTFETNQIICYLENGDKVESLKVYTSDEFSALVGKKIRRKSFWNSVGENLATMNAGTTTSTTSGYVNSAGVAVDNQGYAAAGISSSYGSVSNKTYSGAAQYQANQTARQNANQYNEQLEQYKQALDQGYLQSNTINPGESITGNVNTKYIFKKGSQLILKIPVNGKIYGFSWNLNK